MPNPRWLSAESAATPRQGAAMPDPMELAQSDNPERVRAFYEEEALCEDCPPLEYPTDKTRCLPCPRREA